MSVTTETHVSQFTCFKDQVFHSYLKFKKPGLNTQITTLGQASRENVLKHLFWNTNMGIMYKISIISIYFEHSNTTDKVCTSDTLRLTCVWGVIHTTCWHADTQSIQPDEHMCVIHHTDACGHTLSFFYTLLRECTS